MIITVVSNPKISVIVPVYNSESTLRRCVDSVLAQSFTDFECLLINDGSKDRSGAICDEYAASDSRIRVFHKENGGVSSARNVGLDNMRGEWVTFVDSDDWLVFSAFDEINVFGEVDLAVMPYYEYYESSMQCPFRLKAEVLNNRSQLKTFYSEYITTGLLKCVCGKIYKARILDDIRFDERIILGEDTLFFLNAFVRVNSLRIIPEPCYVYRLLPYTGKYKQDVSDSIYRMRILYEAYEQNGVVVPEFEKQVFLDSKSLCQKQLDKDPQNWYKNEYVSSRFKRLRNVLSLEYKLRYRLQSISLFRYIISLFR